MEPLGSFLKVLHVLPREKIEDPPRDFLKVKPKPPSEMAILVFNQLHTKNGKPWTKTYVA